MGIFDGEGSITAHMKECKRWALSVSVTIGNEVVCRMFLERWGGSLSVVKKQEGRQQLYRWYTSGSKALPFLLYASEHSVVKNRQAVLAVRLAKNMARYTNENRKGIAVSRGQRYITEEDQAERTAVCLEIRSLNGQRARWGDVRP